jgi:hypothetical protein
LNKQGSYLFLFDEQYKLKVLYNHVLVFRNKGLSFDELMIQFIQYKISEYVYKKIAKVQALYKGYLTRKIFNKNRHRYLVHIKLLPPKYIHSNFPGGQEYLSAFAHFTASYTGDK